MEIYSRTCDTYHITLKSINPNHELIFSELNINILTPFIKVVLNFVVDFWRQIVDTKLEADDCNN